MSTRAYVGDGIVVHWDSDRCFHSERCTSGLPEVFDRARRPWVDATAASADAIAAVIDTCPSGALTYTRTDGAPNGRRGRAADEDPSSALQIDPEWIAYPTRRRGGASSTAVVTITPLLNGPLSISGSVAIVAPDGDVEVARSPQLCRCGHSAAKPFCDGSHVRIGFVAPGSERSAPPLTTAVEAPRESP